MDDRPTRRDYELQRAELVEGIASAVAEQAGLTPAEHRRLVNELQWNHALNWAGSSYRGRLSPLHHVGGRIRISLPPAYAKQRRDARRAVDRVLRRLWHPLDDASTIVANSPEPTMTLDDRRK